MKKILSLQAMKTKNANDSVKESNISIACKKKSSVSAFSCVFK